MQNRKEKQFVFGPFTLDPTGVELRRGHETIPLRPKCFDLLLYFLQNPGRLITKEELLQRIWSDVIVNEGTVNRTVTALRSSLDDKPQAPSFIETVSRRGYKFIGAVQASGAEDVDLKSEAFALVHDSRTFPLPDGEHLIGRGHDVEIALYGTAVSRHHARIAVSGTSVTLEDLGSRNGTRVNGTPALGVVALQSGDEISIGDEHLTLWWRSGETVSRSAR